MVKILAISGSAREASTNTALLRGLQRLAPAGVDITVISDLNALPVFSPDMEGDHTPPSVLAFMEKLADTDGVIISSPEYVRAIPGGLKNAIDWMVSRLEVIDKPIALVHASHRGDDMLASLRLVLATVSRHFLDSLFLRIPLIGQSPQDIATQLRQPAYQSQISTFLASFCAACQVLGQPTHADEAVVEPHQA